MSTSEAGPSSTLKRSLNRQEILEEDEYTAALSHIIARDFFPSLVHLDATNNYLDALRSDDPSLLHASVRRLQEIDSTPAHPVRRDWWTPSETPYDTGPSDTPLRTPREVEPAAKRPRFDTNMSLDAFQARHTSEDNASFTQIMHEENRQRRERWGWAWEAQKRVEEQRDKMLEARERMLIEQPSGPGVREKLVIEAPTIAGLITAEGESHGVQDAATRGDDDPKGKGLAVVNKDMSGQVVDVMAPKKDARPAGVDAWKFRTRNSLMFPPDADVSPYDPSTFTVSTKPDVVPRVVKHDNTRLPEQDTSGKSLSAPSSPTHSRIDAAIEGTPYRPKSPTAGTFSLVPNVPSPTAEQMDPKAVKQLMTWGTLNATPRIISQSDDVEEMQPPSTFQISAPSNREVLSHRLSASAAKSLRAKAGLLNGSSPLLRRTPSRTPARGSMAPPSWTPRRADAPGNLTPAARRLLDRTTLGTAAARRADAMGKMSGWGGGGSSKEKDLNHVRWTPTPVARKG